MQCVQMTTHILSYLLTEGYAISLLQYMIIGCFVSDVFYSMSDDHVQEF